MQRYFAYIDNGIVNLSQDDIHHIVHVMRMKIGDRFEVVDNKIVNICEIKNINPLNIQIVDVFKEDVELDEEITLFFALAKGDKIDLVIQKATELGVKRIILFNSVRTVVKFDKKDIEKKIKRFKKIAKEASEQCHRLIIPEIIGVIDLKDIDNYLSDINYLAYEKEAGVNNDSLKIENNKSISIMIGPEGGFEQKEVDYLLKKNFKSVSLGKRILRCETAAIYALSVISCLLEK